MKTVRMANLIDASDMAEIYRPYVVDSAISFESTPPGPQEMADRISQTLSTYPWLVYEEGGTVLGYAYGGAWKGRSAYDWSAEVTVYVRKGHHGKGIGKQLYQALIEALRAQGVVNIIGGIALPNPASVALHESLGFKPVAQFNKLGFKLGKWWDVGYWQLELSRADSPNPITKRQDLKD